jgi:hypothetical protein
MHTEPDEVIEKLTRPPVKKTNFIHTEPDELIGTQIFESGSQSVLE